ncbi:GAF domain-containing protein [Novosphingobium album (ex Hu et al. 2023)]|uniref:GAF domain-containing protein n=1 Tax=Novosphingobium album (ex Hu et al. 2023) TaxID=2930093 RepID=A0ABT0B177_9SPHN|nr:GAF domain-containing protein [Novosphingobium album (ex Hu et al. 2023)]MCJ2178823.1 GAF domain-containing protein [Novosphingobium album (ex Hu et al. 2023)]
MRKEPFIRATEVWVPTSDGKNIDLQAGLYGDLDNFAAISRGMRFAHGEGLPGKTWQAGHPIVLKDLRNSYFRRGDAAMSDGLSCAVAVPTFADGTLKSVIVFFCGDDRFRVGALELWSRQDGDIDLNLVDGYFGRAEKFEFTSRNTSFPRRMGLPGRVWDSGHPEILDDFGRGNMFLRRDAAEKVGINRAVGIPCSSTGDKPWVLTFLSAQNSPIAGRFEIWTKDGTSGGYRFEHGFCESGEDLNSTYAGTLLPADTGPIAKAAATGVPSIVDDIGAETGPAFVSAKGAGHKSMVALPIPGQADFDTVLAWFV